MIILRFVFGTGGESLAVAQNTYAVSWFKGKELNMVFGFQLSVARVGSTVNFLTMGPLFAWIAETLGDPGHTAVGWTLLIAGSSCIMSLLCSLILAWMDKRRWVNQDEAYRWKHPDPCEAEGPILTQRLSDDSFSHGQRR